MLKACLSFLFFCFGVRQLAEARKTWLFADDRKAEASSNDEPCTDQLASGCGFQMPPYQHDAPYEECDNGLQR